MNKFIQRIKKKIIQYCSKLYRLDLCNTSFSSVEYLLGRIVGYLDKRDDVKFLNLYGNANATSPIQKDEAFLLYGIVKTMRPKVIVEFGFSYGHSSNVFVQASNTDTLIYSYDITDTAEKLAQDLFLYNKNYLFIKKSQDLFSPSDINGRKIDIVFFDASHDLTINLKTFSLIKNSLLTESIIVVHDTGLWNKNMMLDRHFRLLNKIKHKWIDEDLLAHQIDERIFVNSLLKENPDLQAIHFHSLNYLRHGLTILSMNKFLKV